MLFIEAILIPCRRYDACPSSTSWIVCCYDKVLANEHARLAQNEATARHTERLKTKGEHCDDDSWREFYDDRWDEPTQYDPDYQTDFSGTEYDVIEIELRNGLP